MDELDDDPAAARADAALRVLSRRTPAPVGWQPADRIRRVAVRRRYRRGISAGVVVLLATATAVALTTGGPSHRTPSQAAPSLPSGPVRTAGRVHGAIQLVADASPLATANPQATAAVADAEQRMSMALLQQLDSVRNMSVSPASLYFALGMLQNGARGETERQIASALQASVLSTAEQNAGLAGLTDELASAAAKDGITLQSANSIWQQRGFPVRPAFLTSLSAYFRTGVWQVDFQRDMPGALKAIDAWTKQQTHGLITKLFDELDPATVMVLANAVYFHAAWQTPFDGHATEPGTFTTATGKRVTAKFMSGGPGLVTAITQDYQAVQLPYTGGRFAALAVMPTHGPLAAFVRTLTASKISAITGSLGPHGTVLLPRFTTTTMLDLVPTLQALGMRDAFGSNADFSRLSDEATSVSQAIQRVYLAVGEKGTTAAAVTGIAMVVSDPAPAPTIRFDHPFLFLVRDTKTGAILFASEINDPSAD